MAEESYLRWLANETPTTWWNDSADPDEIGWGLDRGITGVTTNPVLAHRTMRAHAQEWASVVRGLSEDLTEEQRAEALMRHVVTTAGRTLEPVYERTAGKLGYVCAQVNPAIAANTVEMLAMARRFHAWAPNIAVKLPVTAAGLDTLEECAAEGITVTATVSFTVPQVLAVAERYRRGLARARGLCIDPGQCFAVIMAGRLDDYLRDVALDRKAAVSESDITQASLAASKRAYAIYKERGYEAVLLIAALRGNYHTTEMAGAEVVMSIPPRHQDMLLAAGLPREERIDVPVAADVIQRLRTIPEFVRAYEPDGMAPEDFITYGPTQRTLTQFNYAGWAMLGAFRLRREGR